MQGDRQDIWLVDLIDEHLYSKFKPPTKGVFYPSTLSNKCDRAVWLAYHGHMPELPLPSNLARIFQNGSSLEDRVSEWFADLGILDDREVVVKNDDPPISGRIDFIINHKHYGLIPIELKSINTAGFSKLKGAKEDHYTQLQIYLNLAEYPIGTVLYENKNDQKIKAFFVERDKEFWYMMVRRCLNISNMKKPPEKCGGLFYCNCRQVKGVEL